MTTNSTKSHKEGITLFRAGKYAEALEKFEIALQSETDSKHIAEIYNDIGVTHKELEAYPAAYLALNEAMSRFTELADEKGQAQTLGNRACDPHGGTGDARTVCRGQCRRLLRPGLLPTAE